jgi:hypothetical protein
LIIYLQSRRLHYNIGVNLDYERQHGSRLTAWAKLGPPHGFGFAFESLPASTTSPLL